MHATHPLNAVSTSSPRDHAVRDLTTTSAGTLSRRGFLTACGLVIAGAGLGLAGCGGGQAAGTATDGSSASAVAASGSLKTIRIGMPGDVGKVSFGYNAAVAYKKGVFDQELEKAGYKAEYTGFPQAGPAINEAFAAKAIDVAQYSEFPAITIRSKGVDVKAFAVSDAAQAFGLLATKASGIKKVEDLKGKKVATGVGTVQQRYLSLALKKAGLTTGDVQVVNAAAGDAPSMLASKSVDAWACMYQLVYTNADKVDGTIIATSLDDPSQATTSNFFTRTEFAKDNEAALVAIVKASKWGYDYAKEHPDEARKIMAEISGTDQKAVDAEFEDDGFPTFDPEITDDVKARYQSVEQFLLDSQLIKQSVDIDDFVDTSIYQKA